MFDIEPDNSPSATLRRMLLVLIAALVMACGIAARADSVTLYDQAGIDAGKVTLAHIAELKGPHARALGGIVLATLKDGRQELDVSLDDVEDALDKAGVNWGLVSLRGFGVCRVTRLAPPPDASYGTGQSVAANIETPIGLDSRLTLRARVEGLISERAGVPLSDLRITFSERDGMKLNRPALGQTIQIEPTGLNTLGRVPLTVRLYESGQLTQTLHVRAKVQRVLLAVVTTGPVSRGQVFIRSDLEVRECYLEDDSVTPITDPMIALGQQATATLRVGEVLLARKVKAPIMVKRGELVTVRCMVGGLVVRTVGKAASDAAFNEMIQVRVEKSNEYIAAVVTGRGEAAIAPEPAIEDQRQARAWAMDPQGARR